jgi:hypothetical protein
VQAFGSFSAGCDKLLTSDKYCCALLLSQIAMLILLSLLISTAADTYVWQHSSNWGNPANWNQSRLPCVAETAFLDHPPTHKDNIRSNKFQVTIDVNTTIKRFVLAPGGQVRLQRGTQLRLSDKTTCKGHQQNMLSPS